jgi:hypothetical protein
LQGRARDHRRVDHAGGHEIDDLVGRGVQALAFLGLAHGPNSLTSRSVIGTPLAVFPYSVIWTPSN